MTDPTTTPEEDPPAEADEHDAPVSTEAEAPRLDTEEPTTEEPTTEETTTEEPATEEPAPEAPATEREPSAHPATEPASQEPGHDGPGGVDLLVYRGDAEGGTYVDYTIEEEPGMVVLDAIHRIQEKQDGDLAVRWNCKAGKCGSCSAEINGKPALMCMTRVDEVDQRPIQVAPVKAFPVVKDLVTDVSWNYETKQKITPFTPREFETESEKQRGEFQMLQQDIDRVQEFRKCIECFLCQNVCHVLRTHDLHAKFQGPRFLIHYAQMEMNPADNADRVDEMWDEGGIGYCNITKCCTDVCPENINLTDNGIIPMKERVADQKFDPITMLWRKVRGKS